MLSILTRLTAARRAALPVLAALTLVLSACAAPRELPDSAPPVSRGLSAAEAARAVATFPPGPGRDVLAAACANCHNLGGIEPFRGYYDAARWRRLVDTMIAHGAKLDETETDVLVDYLVEHFGPGTR